MRRIRWTRGRIVVATLAALAVAVALDYALYPQLAPIGGEPFRMWDNAIWLRYTWYTGEQSRRDLPDLVIRLEDRGIGHLYFHVGEIGADGRLQLGRLESGKRLIDALRWNHNITPMAWVLARNREAGGEVDIGDPAVRANMVKEAVWLVEEAGFRGVQWDWEFAPGASDDLIALLRETREALPLDTISVTTPPWMPWPLGRWGWSEDDFTRVAAACDQVCVMCYDTGMFLPRAYVWLVRQQVLRVAPAVEPVYPGGRLYIGVPTWGDEGSLPSHHAHAENLRMALKGLREGHAGLRSRHPDMMLPGAAIFANWTTDEAEWSTWEELWRVPSNKPRGGWMAQ